MSKFSSFGGGLVPGRRHRRVTLIQANAAYAAARRAKMAFWVTCLVAGLMTASIATSRLHPALALALGALMGTATGFMAWTIARIWPLLQRLWWWAPEIIVGGLAFHGFTTLANATSPAVTAAVSCAVIGIPVAMAPIRRPLWALILCQVMRHRLRMAFTDFIKSNQHGTLPLILWAIPTPAGERIFVWLRPGLSKLDLEARLDKLAVACWANQVTIERPRWRNAAFLRIDITRRDVLQKTITSPLLSEIDPDTPPNPRQPMTPPTALDLPQVTVDPSSAPNRHRYRPNSLRDNNTPGEKPAAAADSGDDFDQWI